MLPLIWLLFVLAVDHSTFSNSFFSLVQSNGSAPSTTNHIVRSTYQLVYSIELPFEPVHQYHFYRLDGHIWRERERNTKSKQFSKCIFQVYRKGRKLVIRTYLGANNEGAIMVATLCCDILLYCWLSITHFKNCRNARSVFRFSCGKSKQSMFIALYWSGTGISDENTKPCVINMMFRLCRFSAIHILTDGLVE